MLEEFKYFLEIMYVLKIDNKKTVTGKITYEDENRDKNFIR